LFPMLLNVQRNAKDFRFMEQQQNLWLS